MADCSKTEVFLAEWMRICDNNNTCAFCPANGYLCKRCYMYDRSKLEEHKKTISTMIATVQNWSDDHPEPKPKTYADDFFEKHPNAPYRIEDGLKIPKICRTGCYAVKCSYPGTGLFNPPECNKCWNEPYKEEETNE